MVAATLGILVAASGCASTTAESATGDKPYSPTPFSASILEAEYSSDRTIDYVPILDAFDDIRKQHPEIIDLNMQKTIDINHSSSEEQRERARADQYQDMSITMADGLGENLGEIYADAATNGLLPKTMALISKDEQRAAGDGASSNPSKEYFAFPRPYIADPDAIEYIDKEGGDAYDSTSGAYPSGHTSQAYWQGTLLATMLPELADGILARTSEAGHNRIVMGVHYPLDVIGGRMMGQAIAAKRWADPEFRVLFKEASEELRAVLESECGDTLAVCIADDTPYLSATDAAATYENRMTYGFEQIGQADQPFTAPEMASTLLISSHPDLTDEQREQVLQLTALDSGYPLDKSGTDGGWQRMNLLAAMTAEVSVDADGTVKLVG